MRVPGCQHSSKYCVYVFVIFNGFVCFCAEAFAVFCFLGFLNGFRAGRQVVSQVARQSASQPAASHLAASCWLTGRLAGRLI